MNIITEKEFWLLIRQALLMIVDAIERKCGLPRTSEARRIARRSDCDDA